MGPAFLLCHQLPSVREFRVRGLCAATYTAFNDDLSLNLDAIPAQVDELLRGGVKYIFGALQSMASAHVFMHFNCRITAHCTRAVFLANSWWHHG